METSNVKLYNCKIDSDLKEGKNGDYTCVTKAYVGEEKLESIFYLSLDKEQYKYINRLDYKNILFNMKGIIQVRKNKKDIPFLFFKCSYIQSLTDIEKIKNRKRIEKKNTQVKIEWTSKIPNIEEKLVELDNKKIKFIDEIHKGKAIIDLGSVREDYVPTLAVKPIEGSDEYSLLFGFKGLIIAKMLDLKTRAYITDCNREELIERLDLNKK